MNELEEKTHRLLRTLKSENLGGVLLNSQHNFAWLTGGAGNGVDLSQTNGVGSLLISSDGKRYLLANKIEMPRLLCEEVSEKDFEPIEFPWQADKINGSFVPETAHKLLKNKPLLTDVFYHTDFRVGEGLVAKCRFSLTKAEVERISRLGKDAGEVLGSIYKQIEPGQTEQQIANLVRFELGKHGINSVVTLVAADERMAKYRHPVPTENVWKKTLMIVVCAKRHGLIVSLSRIFSVGSIDENLKRKTASVAKVHARMMHSTVPGATGKDIFTAAQKSYAELGFSGEENMHHQGGACGYKTRDWVAHSESSEQIFVNQAFAWNPSITGTKSEETFLVREKGIEVLTTSPGFPVIENVIQGKTYLTPDILVI